MDVDRRIVPEKHILSVLAEDHISERTIAVKKLLHSSPDKIHHAAHTWMEYSGLNPMARIIIHHVPNVPKRHHASHTTTPAPAHHIHGVHHEEHTHDHHKHASEDLHAPDEHHHSSGHSQDGHHAHDAHGHGNHHSGGDEHAHHGHHRGGTFSGFVSTGHWFGDQGAYIFGMLGRILGEIIGYLLKTLAVAVIFGPTRTTLLVFLVSMLLNTTLDIILPVWIMSGVAGIIHLIFTGVSKVGGGGHSESHGGGHGGGHGHH